MGYPVMTNDRDNDRRLAYAIWHNDCRMIRLMMCAPGAINDHPFSVTQKFMIGIINNVSVEREYFA